jgi:replicative DNA helicase
MSDAELRTPPHDLDAEQSVLGSVLVSQEAIVKLAGRLRPDHFYRATYGAVYRAALQLFERGEPVDNITVAQELRSMTNGEYGAGDWLDRVGGRTALAGFQQAVPTAANALHYADIVIEKSRRRRAIEAFAKGTALAYDESRPAVEVLDEASEAIFRVAVGNLRSDFRDMGDLASNALERMTGGEIAGIPTGFGDLDHKTDGGFRPEELIVIAARPGVGKTSLGLNIALNVAGRGLGVAFFSLEMSAQQLADRMIAQISKVPVPNFRRGPKRCQPGQWDKVQSALDTISTLPVFVDDDPLLDPLTLISKARMVKQRHEHTNPIRLVILDYLQLMSSGSGKTAINREQEVANAARTLKRLARELKVPVIAMAQLNRESEKRANKRPTLADLRESGEIEQVSDIVLAIYREDANDEGSPVGAAELIIAKHRNGPTGSIPLGFRADLTEFYSIEQQRTQQGGYQP